MTSDLSYLLNEINVDDSNLADDVEYYILGSDSHFYLKNYDYYVNLIGVDKIEEIEKYSGFTIQPM